MIKRIGLDQIRWRKNLRFANLIEYYYSPRMLGIASGVASRQRQWLPCFLFVIATIAMGILPAQADEDPPPLLSMQVLVLDDGSPMVDAMAERLLSEGIPVTKLDLTAPERPTITDAFLAASNKGKFYGVVLPSDSPEALSETERLALEAYEREYEVRQVSMYDWANPAVGLNYAENPGHVGSVDGLTADITTAGLDGPFRYLEGSVELDDFDPDVTESYGYLARPLELDPYGGDFLPLVTTTIPGTDADGVLIGEYTQGGRERLIITFAQNRHQHHFKILSHGIVSWLTRGASTSFNRNYLSIHSDDLFMSDAKWSIPGNCTIGDGCDPVEYPVDAPGSTVRMEASDIDRLVRWQDDFDLKIDQAFNGFGSEEFRDIENLEVDPLLAASSANAEDIRWLNHTYKHEFMGCQQTSNTPPWTCLTDTEGQTLWYPQQTIESEITSNVQFADTHDLPLDPSELVTGEHSGLKTLPQQPVDNPYLLNALGSTGVTWTASDASREFDARAVGAATSVPRYPMNLYYNVSTKAEATAEFNWIYTKRQDGGSGLCEDHPETSTCIDPLDLETGFDSFIRPLESRVMFGHVADNDPRPHFAHQSNLADDAILYPVLGDVVTRYRDTFSEAAPLVNPAMAAAGSALVDQQDWAASASMVEATLQGGVVLVHNTSTHDIRVPVTVPEGTTVNGAPFGESYGSEQSAWVELEADEQLSLTLPTAQEKRSSQTASVDAMTVVPRVATRPAHEGSTRVVEPNSASSEAIEQAGNTS